MITPEEAKALLATLPNMPPAEQKEVLQLLEERERRVEILRCQTDFHFFMQKMSPFLGDEFKDGAHLRRLAKILMKMEQGESLRLAVSVAPRHSKSQTTSILFPAWYLGKHPNHKIIIATHTADLAVKMSRKVRNLLQTPYYQEIFPETEIASDAKAAGAWNTTKGGEYFAVGAGGAVAGHGGHLVLVDDPLSEQDLMSGNLDILDNVYNWFMTGPRTRLQPNAGICVLHCLTGDTLVRYADGSSKPIKDVRPGDTVVGYKNGKLTPAKVLGWSNQGLDHIYSLRLKSGVIIKGNARHPFLVDFFGERKWVKIKDLKVGMRLLNASNPTPDAYVVPKAVTNLPTPLVSASSTTTKTDANLVQRLSQLTGVNGVVKSAQRTIVRALRTLTGCASSVITKLITPRKKQKAGTTAQSNAAMLTSKCSMGSLAQSTTVCSPLKMACVLFVHNHLVKRTPPLLGKCAGWLWTTVTRPIRFAHSCVTHATLSLKSAILSSYYAKPLSTLNITLDEIVEIAQAGEDYVFDIQVEGTESFLANGVVSHNTRWHQRDLIGRLVKDMTMNPDADQYEVFEFPAILNEGTPEVRPLWGEMWSLESLLKTKASIAPWIWNANYMQNPTGAESTLIQKGWFHRWELDDPPKCEFLIMSLDAAVEAKTRSDFNALQVWGVFFNEETNRNEIILLDAIKRRLEFPELKVLCAEQAQEWEPDSFIIEAKANGAPLFQELRRTGAPVQAYIPHRGTGDKIARVNSVSDIIKDGCVWLPETRWAEEFLEEVGSFPAGENDDAVDAMFLALYRFRQGGFLTLSTDEKDTDYELPARNIEYY